MFTSSEILGTRRFPGFAVFHYRVRDFRLLRCCVSPCTRCYIAILTLYLYVDPTSRGTVFAAWPPLTAITFTCIAPRIKTVVAWTSLLYQHGWHRLRRWILILTNVPYCTAGSYTPCGTGYRPAVCSGRHWILLKLEILVCIIEQKEERVFDTSSQFLLPGVTSVVKGASARHIRLPNSLPLPIRPLHRRQRLPACMHYVMVTWLAVVGRSPPTTLVSRLYKLFI